MYHWIANKQSTAPQTTPQFILKAHLPTGEIRRSKLDIKPLSFEQLTEQIAKLYLSEQERNHQLVLKYRDERNDWITFDTEEEFQDAIEILRYEQTKNPTSALSVQITIGDLKPVDVAVEEEEEVEIKVEVDVQQDEDSVSSDSESEDEVEPAEEKPVEPQPFDASFIVVNPEEKEEVVVEDKIDEQDEIERIRQSQQLLRQSMGSFLLQAPAQPVVEEPLPEPKYEEEPAPVVEQVKEIVEEKVPSPFEKQLQTLAEMGFDDRVKNEKLLEQHKGDVVAVVSTYFPQ